MIHKRRSLTQHKGVKLGLTALLLALASALLIAIAASADTPPPPPPGGQQPPPGGQQPPPPPPGGQYPGQPPSGQQPGQPPSGQQPGQPGKPGQPGQPPQGGGGPCVTPPAGIDPTQAGPIFQQLPDLFKTLGHPPNKEDIDKLVAQAAAKAGVSDPKVIDFVKEEIASHMPGGKCQGEGGQYNPAADQDGMPDGGYEKGFLNKIWRFVCEPDSYKGRTLTCTLVKILNLPKKFEEMDDEIIDQDMQVIFATTSGVFEDRHGDEINMKELVKADQVWVKGKLADPKNWGTDEDDRPVPTVRGRRAAVIKA